MQIRMYTYIHIYARAHVCVYTHTKRRGKSGNIETILLSAQTRASASANEGVFAAVNTRSKYEKAWYSSTIRRRGSYLVIARTIAHPYTGDARDMDTKWRPHAPCINVRVWVSNRASTDARGRPDIPHERVTQAIRDKCLRIIWLIGRAHGRRYATTDARRGEEKCAMSRSFADVKLK